jgi:uncharacterized RDD family membrane protein YckC
VLEHVRRRQVFHELHGSVLVVPADAEWELRHVLAQPSEAGFDARDPAGLPAAVRVTWRSRRHAAVSNSSREYRLASRWARFGGFVVDLVIAAAVYSLVARAARAVGATDDAGGELAVVAIVAWWTRALLETVPVARWGWTLGKLAVGTRVVGTETLAPPGIPRAVLRWMVVALPEIVAVAVWGLLDADVLGLAVLWGGAIAVHVGVLVERDRRGLHDLAARTLVVRARSLRRFSSAA